MTSSEMKSAPLFWQASLSPWLKPGRGGTTPMLPGEASVITQAISPGCRWKASCTASRSLYGRTMVSLGLGAGDAGGVGKREGGDPGAGRREERVDVPVVAAA